MKLTSNIKHQLICDIKDIEFSTDETQAHCLSLQDESIEICVGGIMTGPSNTWYIMFIDSLSNRLFDLIIPEKFFIDFNGCSKITVTFNQSSAIFNLEATIHVS